MVKEAEPLVSERSRQPGGRLPRPKPNLDSEGMRQPERKTTKSTKATGAEKLRLARVTNGATVRGAVTYPAAG
eukprot:6190029-Pleurochrysis_carterae.AAC.6